VNLEEPPCETHCYIVHIVVKLECKHYDAGGAYVDTTLYTHTHIYIGWGEAESFGT
jgi:hypothetical protein